MKIAVAIPEFWISISSDENEFIKQKYFEKNLKIDRKNVDLIKAAKSQLMKNAIDLEPKYTLYLPYDEERNIGTCNDAEY